jgi:hypothetical protein
MSRELGYAKLRLEDVCIPNRSGLTFFFSCLYRMRLIVPQVCSLGFVKEVDKTGEFL